MQKQLPIMAHLVLGYPTLADSLATAETYIRAGVQTLELQIPFSHPTADGPVITAACQEAAGPQGVTVADCLAAIRSIRERFPEQEIIVMSYLNRLFTYGLGKFAQALDHLNIRHLIVPDLPVDSALAAEITLFRPTAQSRRTEEHAGQIGLVPVLAANISDERLEKLLSAGFDFYYLMADFKITGAAFSLHPRLKTVIATIKKTRPTARIGIGFGISTPEQARLAAEEADLAIIGSALIRAQEEGQLDGFLSDLQEIFAPQQIEQG